MAEQHQIDPSTAQNQENISPNYDNEIKRLIAQWLAAELTDKAEKISHETSKQALKERKWKLTVGKRIVLIAATLPLVFFIVLAWQICSDNSAFNALEDIPQAILISASILSFVAIYAVLIKGMFQHAKDDGKDSHPINEVTNIMRRFLSKPE